MAKRIYIGVPGESLVVNGNLNNGTNGWTPATELNTAVVDGVLEMITAGAITGARGMRATLSKDFVEGHVYYCSFEAKTSTAVGEGMTCKLYNDIVSNNVSVPVDGNWHKLSFLHTCQMGTEAYTLSFVLYNTRAIAPAYLDNVVLYDLTALYGAGNEPTQEWCDTNLEALEALYKSQADGIARKVKKAYVGAGGNLVVNGNFSNGLKGWDITNADAGNVTLANKDGYTCIELYRNSTSTTNSYFGTDQELSLDVSNHKIYISGYVRGEASNAEGAVGLKILFTKDSTLYSGGTTVGNGTILEEWTQTSQIKDWSSSTVTITQITCAINSNATNSHVYWRDIRLYDLTALYGAGNEPTQEWCDANLEALAKKSVARKVKKGYIGVGGVARLFYSTEKELSYYGTATALSTARDGLAATTVGDYALFGGGYDSSYSSKVDSYTSTLSKGTATALSTARNRLAATTVGEYAFFAGGYTGSASSKVDTYNTSKTKGTATALSKSRADVAATTVGDYALFCGGYTGSGRAATVDAYNSSKTRSTQTALSAAINQGVATTVGDYALISGGNKDDGTKSATVDTYTSALVKGTAADLTIGRVSLAATTAGDYALFGGGSDTDSNILSVVDVYTSTLAKGTPLALSVPRGSMTAASISGFGVFAGGYSTEYCGVVDVYSPSLTRSTATNLSVGRIKPAATTVGDYVLFGGGENADGNSKVVDVYQLAEP